MFNFLKIFIICLMSIFFISCTEEVLKPYDDGNVSSPYVTLSYPTNISVTSNGFDLPNYEKWQSDRNWENVPENPVPQDEIDYVINYIKEHPDEGYDVCDWTNYYIQPIGSSKDSYHLNFMNGEQIHHSTDIVGGNQMDYLVIDGYHINDYNASWGSFGLCTNMSLENITYHDSYANLTIENAYKFYYIEYNGKVNVYLCFDYRTTKYDNGLLEFDGDGVYNDWVVKLSPSDGSTVSKPNGDTPTTPEEPITPPTKDENTETIDEVEVNLEGTDKNGEYLESHLSIHVRSNTDVELFIPVPVDYYCDVDDMAIVNKHQEGLMIHGGPDKTTYNINGNDVNLYVEYLPTGIRIWTEGINEDVISYCQEKYGDGLTFEVWNYFNELIDLDTLKDYLNKSTIKFLDKEPDSYINSFSDDNDCTVNIVDEQSGDYSDGVCGEHGCHSNGSENNTIYDLLK